MNKKLQMDHDTDYDDVVCIFFALFRMTIIGYLFNN